MSTRLKPIDSLARFKSRTVKLAAPKSAAHKAPDYLVLHEPQLRTKTVNGKKVQVKVPARDIYPEPSSMNAANACSMGKGKHQLRAGCHVEFLLLGTKHATARGVAPGAYLQLCQKVHQKNAPLIRVRDHQEALKVSRDYCACAKKKGASTDACARQATGSSGSSAKRRR
jgi:hypothetical protein